MSLESLIGVAYSFYTLACAVIFPVAAAVAVFACLRRAGTVRKILGYFISMPVYGALCIFVLCEPQKSVPSYWTASNTLMPDSVKVHSGTGYSAVSSG